jgi:hypothetical protein
VSGFSFFPNALWLCFLRHIGGIPDTDIAARGS